MCSLKWFVVSALCQCWTASVCVFTQMVCGVCQFCTSVGQYVSVCLQWRPGLVTRRSLSRCSSWCTSGSWHLKSWLRPLSTCILGYPWPPRQSGAVLSLCFWLLLPAHELLSWSRSWWIHLKSTVYLSAGYFRHHLCSVRWYGWLFRGMYTSLISDTSCNDIGLNGSHSCNRVVFKRKRSMHFPWKVIPGLIGVFIGTHLLTVESAAGWTLYVTVLW